MKLLFLAFIIAGCSSTQNKNTTLAPRDLTPEIRKTFFDNLHMLRICYLEQLDKGNKQKGIIEIFLEIAKSGKPIPAATRVTGNLNQETMDCLIAKLNEVTFPEPSVGNSYTIKQPMNFYPKKD